MSIENLETKFNRTSKVYDLIDYPFERWRYQKLRKRIWANLFGQILDVGVGTGCNIPFYPDDATVIGVDISAGMLAKAKKKALKLGKKTDLRKASVYELPFPDETFDVIVATFLCCVVSDPPQAARELKRVLKKDGKIIFLEYVFSKKPMRRLIQRAITPYTRTMFGVDFTQNTLKILKDMGLAITKEEDITSDILKLIIARPE
jgi:phosphatidylethanolamine/phosphatidyl-N-methylethanolamine N-methyltransferase